MDTAAALRSDKIVSMAERHGSEAGVPGYDLSIWHALLAPAGTPSTIIDRLNRETIAVLNNREFNNMLVEEEADLNNE